MEERRTTRIHGVQIEDYITGKTEDGKLEVDFTSLNEAINNSATCATLNCDAGVAGDGICMGCMMAHILNNMEWVEEQAAWRRTDLEEADDAG
jgi:hypothetical protein